MAQTQKTAGELWAEAGARCGFAVHNGLPLIGISGDEGDGFIVPLPTPDYFSHVRDEGTADNLFRAVAAHALRVGQAKLKAADSPTRQAAVDGVASAVNGGYKPGRERGNDIVEKECLRRMEATMRANILKAKPDASEKQITDTIAANSDTPAAKKFLADERAKVIEAGTYTVVRKGKGASGALDLAGGLFGN